MRQEVVEITIRDLYKPTDVKELDRHAFRISYLTSAIARIVEKAGNPLDVAVFRDASLHTFYPPWSSLDQYPDRWECVALFRDDSNEDPGIILKPVPDTEGRFLVRLKDIFEIPPNLHELVQQKMEKEIEYMAQYPVQHPKGD